MTSAESEYLLTNVQRLLNEKELRQVRDVLLDYSAADVADVVKALSADDQAMVFRILPRELAAQTFAYLTVEDQKRLFRTLGQERFAKILNEMSPDDRTALLEEFPAQAVRNLIALLSKDERKVALTLLGFPDQSVGRLMTPDYLTVQEDWSIAQVLEYVRAQGKDTDTLNVLYIVDNRGVLVDDLRIRQVLLAPPDAAVMQLMDLNFVALHAGDDQEKAVEVFRKYDRFALPVIDVQGHMLGIVTFNDVLDVAEREATEDIQKLGAVEALDYPYIDTPLHILVRKRAVWLIVLFIGEMLTATAMGFYQYEIEQAVVLALFVPLIISSGGNSGSQAASLIIRAIALGELTIKDWRRVMWRELVSGLSLGAILGTIGLLRITVWSMFGEAYGPHWALVAIAVGVSLMAVVTWGTLTGSFLPLVLQRCGVDPATSSAPFVATLVDVTGLVIYFSVAQLFLSGVLL